MLFNSSAFAVFLAVALIIHWSLTGRRARNLFLLGASYLFYGWWDWRFLALLIATSTIDYAMGILIYDSTTPNQRKTWLWVSCATNAATLFVFKYFNFFSENLRVALEGLGVHTSWPVLHIILPVGVSFYTLQAVTYTIDVYRGAMPPCRDYPDFLLFVAYFPQLVAGPISKARQLLPQLQAPRRFDPELASQAIPYIAIGYVLKTVIADNLSVAITSTLANVGAHSGLELLTAIYCSSFEVYGDFAGYSYIALGISMLFGVRLPQNFRSPFLSQSMKEFWTRWNISLTAWFRDYFFFSFVGRRPSVARLRGAIVFTFLATALWHGATWPCMIWGLMQAIAYFIPAPFSERRVVGRVFNSLTVLTFSLAIWRVPSASDVFHIAQRIGTHFLPASGEPSLSGVVDIYGWRIAMIVCLMTFELVQRHAQDLPQIYRWPSPTRYVFYAGLAMVYFYVGNFSRIPFIYFQF